MIVFRKGDRYSASVSVEEEIPIPIPLVEVVFRLEHADGFVAVELPYRLSYNGEGQCLRSVQDSRHA